MITYVKAKTYLKKLQYKKLLNFVPHFFTYLNAIFGVFAILKAFEGRFFMAAFFIIVSALMDGIDGRAARALGVTSLFGMELDSLCDAISFCVAPIIILYCWGLEYFHSLNYTFIAALLFYLCSGLCRLAKFNITAEKQNRFFIGLPTTISALFISLFIIYYKSFKPMHFGLFLNQKFISIGLILLSLLMVSYIPFYAFKQPKSFNKKNLSLLFFLICIGWNILLNSPLPFFIVLGFIIVNIIMYILSNYKRYL